MELRKFKDKNLANYTIVNESGSTSRGFYHDSILMLGSNEIERNRCNYLNRTWECYRFQTSMMGVVRKARDHWEEYYLSKFKNDNEINRMTKKKKEEFEEYLKNKKEIITYNNMLKELELYHC